jgi:hypothetical protein
MMVAALLLYVCAWFLPPLDMPEQPAEGSEQLKVNGPFVFRYTMMMLRIPPPSETMDWFRWKLMGLTGATNLVVPVAIVCVQLDRFWIIGGCSLLACGLLDLLWMYWVPLTGKGCLSTGYFVWLASFWLLSLTCLARAWARAGSNPSDAMC